MSFSLYRKYRPSTFADVIGQDTIIKTLTSQSASHSFAHAYLFTGPRGVGKTTTARIVAKAANCDSIQKDGEPCNTCKSCKVIAEGKAIDIIEIDAASHTGVDHVRTAIIDTSRTSPSLLKYKVFIIDEVHMLSMSSFNALLKTLEEPPSHALFILATTEVQKVPETILSRCQRFRFRRIAVPAIVERLKGIAKAEKVNVDEDVLLDIASRSEGSSRDAESLLGQLFAFESKHITAKQAELVLPKSHIAQVSELLTLMLAGDLAKSIDYIDRFVDDGGDADQMLVDAISYTRLLLLASFASARLTEMLRQHVPATIADRIQQDASSADRSVIVEILETFLRAKKKYVYPEIPQLALELALFECLDNAPSVPRQTGPAAVEKITQPTVKKEQPIQKIVQTKKKSSTPGAVSLARLKEKWQDFTLQVREVNRALSMSMQVAQVVACEGTSVTIAVPYVFHQERIEIPRHEHLIETIVSEYFGTTLKVKCIVDQLADVQIQPQANVEPVKSENLWDQVVEAFGEQLSPTKE